MSKNFSNKLNTNQKVVLNNIVFNGESNKYKIYKQLDRKISERGLSYPIRNLLKNGLIRVIKEEEYANKITQTYDVTFKGFIVWLSLSSNYKGLVYDINSETGELVNFPSDFEKKEFDKINIDIIIRQGKKHNFSIFSNISTLTDYHGDEAFTLLRTIANALFSSTPSIEEDESIRRIFIITKGKINDSVFKNSFGKLLETQDKKWKEAFLEGYLVCLFEDKIFATKMPDENIANELSNLIIEKEKRIAHLMKLLSLFNK